MKVANRPKFRKYIFAENANDDTIEPVPDTETETKENQGYFGYQKGFTETNMKPLTEGGKAIRGQQLNQLLNDITSVTQYSTMGGTYELDPNISNDTGYPQNALVTNDDGVFISLQDDNKNSDLTNTTYWKKIIDFNPPPPPAIKRIVGEFFYSTKRGLKQNGALLCNGAEYNLADYPDLEKYFINNQLHYLFFKDWDERFNLTDGNVGAFGYDQQNKKFRVPKIQSGTYLSPANMPNGDLNQDIVSLSKYWRDQIVNITGETSFPLIAPDGNINNSGCLTTIVTQNYNQRPGGTLPVPDYLKVFNLNFDASKAQGVNVGDRVMPRTIMHNLYVVVSEHY